MKDVLKVADSESKFSHKCVLNNCEIEVYNQLLDRVEILMDRQEHENIPNSSFI